MAVDTVRGHRKSIFSHKSIIPFNSHPQQLSFLLQVNLLIHRPQNILQLFQLSLKLQDTITGLQYLNITLDKFPINLILLLSL